MKVTPFISSAFKAVLPIALFTAMTACAKNKSEFSHTEFTMPADSDSVRVNVKFNAPASGEMIILMDSTNDFIRIKMSPNHQEDLHKTGERKGNSETVAMNFTYMSKEAIEGNKDIKTVGTLKYVDEKDL